MNMWVKKVLKSASSYRLVNSVLRNAGKSLGISVLSRRVRISGKVGLNFNGIGFIMFAKQDDLIVDQLYFEKFDEHYSLVHFLEFVKKSNVILDIGANTGLYSILASKTNNACEIHAFEPYDTNAKRLKFNIDINRINNIDVHTYGLSNENNNRDLYVPLGEQRISQVSSFNETFTKSHKQNDVADYEKKKVEVRTLDSLKYDRVDLIKVDVESHEIAVFLGGIETIIKTRPVILIEIFPSSENNLFFEKFLLEHSYGMFNAEQRFMSKSNLISKNHRNYFLIPSERVL